MQLHLESNVHFHYYQIFYSVSFYAQQAGEVEVSLYASTGNRVFSQSAWVTSGENQMQFDFSQQGFSSGLYLLEVKNASNSLSKRLIFD